MNIIGLFVYSYTRKAHYTGALILMGDLQLCKKSCRNRAWLGVNRCVFVAGKRRKILSIQCQTFGNYELSSKQRYLTEIGQYDSRMQIITLINFSEYNLSISSLS